MTVAVSPGALPVSTAISPGSWPALVLNADYRPLSYYPLSLWSWQDTIKAVFLDRVTVVSTYEKAIHSPSFEMRLPSVVSLKTYGGEDGIMVRRTNELFGLNMRDKATLYWIVLVVAAGYYLFLRRLVNSSFGQTIAGIRQNERRMAAMGVDTTRAKLFAFALSGAGAGLAGALMVNFLRFASPDMMHWTKSGELMVMVILGGVGTLAGPFIGAGALFTLETTLGRFTEHWALPVGIILLVVVLATRGGLMGLVRRIVEWRR